MEYQYRIEPSINEGEVNVIQAAGEAEALWVVTPTSAEISADDSDQNPLESDGCWPEPPTSVIAEARGMLAKYTEHDAALCKEQDECYADDAE